MSIDDLAVMVQKNFDDIESKMLLKTEFNEFKKEVFDHQSKTDMALFELDTHAKETNTRLCAIEETLGPLVQISGVIQSEIRNLNGRVSALERKAGIVKQ